jgi:hypothetical protein
VAAFRIAESRLEEHLDTGPAEPMALANQVVARHSLNAPRERGGHARLTDGHRAANPREELIRHGVERGIRRGRRIGQRRAIDRTRGRVVPVAWIRQVGARSEQRRERDPLEAGHFHQEAPAAIARLYRLVNVPLFRIISRAVDVDVLRSRVAGGQLDAETDLEITGLEPVGRQHPRAAADGDVTDASSNFVSAPCLPGRLRTRDPP